jgi:outer membrane lipoprotein-sorting protein
MTEPNHQPTPDILDRAAEALRTAPVGPLPDRLADAVSAEARRRDRRRRVMRYIRYGSAATVAAGLLVAAGVLWLGGGSAAAQVRAAAENAAKAKSFRMVVRKADGGKLAVAQRIDFQTNASRMETYRTHEVRIADLSRKKELVLDTREKTASVDDISEAQAKQYRTDLMEPFNLLSVLRGKAGTTVRELPQEKLGGRAARVYDIRRPQSKEAARLWVDNATGFPVRFRAGDEARPECVIDFTDWNEKLDSELFSLEIPKGYTTGMQKPPTPPESEPETGSTQFILLHRAMGNAEKAKSVRVRTKLQSGGKVTLEQKGYRLGDLIRSETTTVPMSNGWSVTIADLKTRKALQLNPQDKTARRTTLGRQEARLVSGLLGSFADIKEQLAGGRESAVRDLGFEKLGDRRVNVYEVAAQIPPAGVWRIWVDPKTNLPVRLVAGDKNKITVTFDFEAWNEELDPKLFSLDVPKGYKAEDKSAPKKGDK